MDRCQLIFSRKLGNQDAVSLQVTLKGRRPKGPEKKVEESLERRRTETHEGVLTLWRKISSFLKIRSCS